jgi:hypothetical protein
MSDNLPQRCNTNIVHCCLSVNMVLTIIDLIFVDTSSFLSYSLSAATPHPSHVLDRTASHPDDDQASAHLVDFRQRSQKSGPPSEITELGTLLRHNAVAVVLSPSITNATVVTTCCSFLKLSLFHRLISRMLELHLLQGFINLRLLLIVQRVPGHLWLITQLFVLPTKLLVTH